MSRGGSGRPELCDLAADPGEQNDRAAAEPARVAELTELYDAWNRQQAEPVAADREGPKKNAGKRAGNNAETKAGKKAPTKTAR